MTRSSDDSLQPRNGHTAMVLLVCRISGCARQKELSLEDQLDNGKETAADLYDGPAAFDIISTKGKGESLDRPELEQIENHYRSGKYDLVILDDLSRLIRGGDAARLLGVGVDHGTRTICIEDGIDTANPTWEVDALNACSENVAHNERASRRIKQKTMNRFKKDGHTAARPIAGYFVPEGAERFNDWSKVEAATPVIKEGARRLRESKNCSAVAEYFNSVGFPVGPGCRRTTWNGKLVRRFYKNPLLKGKPQRGLMHSVKTHSSGRRVSKKNPKGPRFFDAPHLAQMDEIEFDSLNALLAETNARYSRLAVNGSDPLLNVSRKRSRFPAKITHCWYCGAECLWGANGHAGHLQCSGSRECHCWNSIGFDAALTARKLVTEITARLYALEGFEDQFAALCGEAQRCGKGSLPSRRAELLKRFAQHEKEKANIQASIRAAGPHALLMQQLDDIDREERKLIFEKYELDSQEQQRLELPESASALREHMEREFSKLAVGSFDFADLIRPLISRMDIYLVRLCDGGHLYSRAKVNLNLAGHFSDVNLVPDLKSLVTEEFTLDLWDTPPQREQIRLRAIELVESGLTQREIAAQLSPAVTQPAVGNALALHARMLALGLTDPWITIMDPPSDYPKLRRHKNPRYRFEPVKGYERQEL